MRQITFRIALLISLGSLAGCAVERSFTVTPIKSVPEGKKQVVRKYSTTLVAGANRTRNVVEVYDIGATVDANGDLVGKHQLYRVVESSRWVLASHVKSPDLPIAHPPTPLQPVPKRDRAAATVSTVPQPTPDLSNAIAGQQVAAPQDPAPAIPDDITKASPAEQQALKEFGNVNPAPTP